MYKKDLAFNNVQGLICHKTQPNHTNHIYLIYMYKKDLALNNLEGLICHKTQRNQTNHQLMRLSLAINNNRKKAILLQELSNRTKFNLLIGR